MTHVTEPDYIYDTPIVITPPKRLNITLGNLGAGEAQASEAVDNNTDEFIDISLQMQFAGYSTSYILLGAYGSLDGVHWQGAEFGIDGTNKRFTSDGRGAGNFTGDGNDYLYSNGDGTITFEATLSQLLSQSAASATAGGSIWLNWQTIPPWWGIIVFNASGYNLLPVETLHFVKYVGYYAQTT